MIFYLGHKVEKVDDKIRKSRNKVKTWEYGYDPVIDTVIISRDGTLGEIYNVRGLNIGLPEKPEHKKIYNWNKTQENHRWTREELPIGLNEDNWRNAEYSDYIEKNMQYRKDGFWLYINGKPVFVTGTYWFFLQWVKIEEEYPNMRIIQNELMIFWEACKADNRCYGMQYVKNRRIGASSMAVAEILLSAIRFRDKQNGIISKTGEDASDIFSRITTAFRRLPPFFQPLTDGTTNPKKVLAFQEPTKKRKKDEKIQEGKGLNTNTTWYSTEKNSMDGKRIFRSLIDEAAKFPRNVPFDRYWSVVKTSHQKGRVIFGKAMVVSTVNALKDGGAEYKRIWDASNLDKRDANGRTLSGLYRIFIPAKYCLEGYFDKYGFSIVHDPEIKVLADDGLYVTEGAETFLRNTLEALKNSPDEYNEQLRQFPDTETDAFRPEASECAFNLNKILEQYDYNTKELNDKFTAETDLRKGNVYRGNDAVQRGNFRWKDGVRDTEVIWMPDPDTGRFYIKNGCHPTDEHRNIKILKRGNGGTSFAPIASHIGCFGVDPYDRSMASDGTGSRGAIHLSTRTSVGHYPNETFILEYIERPPRIEDFVEDVIMAMVYYSMPILPELSNITLLKEILDRGYRNFVMNNPLKAYKDLNANEILYGGIPPQGQTGANAQFYAIEAYVDNYVGVATQGCPREIGEIGDMPFTRTLIQWKDVDMKDRTDFDAYISSSLSRLGCQVSKIKVKEEAPVEKFNFFPKYDNSGVTSKEISVSI